MSAPDPPPAPAPPPESPAPAVEPEAPPELKKDWRFYAGLTALVLSIILPVFAVVVPFLGLPVAWAAALAGALVLGGPEVLALVAVALLGKPTFKYLTYQFKKAFRRAVLERPVSKTRYYTGLTISLLSFVPLYLYGYQPHWLPGGPARIWILAAADLIFIGSFFIMGGEFWEKLRRIFIWEGKV
jgi:hypothetical protein